MANNVVEPPSISGAALNQGLFCRKISATAGTRPWSLLSLWCRGLLGSILKSLVWPLKDLAKGKLFPEEKFCAAGFASPQRSMPCLRAELSGAFTCGVLQALLVMGLNFTCEQDRQEHLSNRTPLGPCFTVTCSVPAAVEMALLWVGRALTATLLSPRHLLWFSNEHQPTPYTQRSGLQIRGRWGRKREIMFWL